MDTRQYLKDDIDRTADSLVKKVQIMEERAANIKEQVYDSISIEHHIDKRPWTILGVAVTVGLFLGMATRR